MPRDACFDGRRLDVPQTVAAGERRIVRRGGRTEGDRLLEAMRGRGLQLRRTLPDRLRLALGHHGARGRVGGRLLRLSRLGERVVERIRERFRPLVKICKEYGTAMRIGTNHGSLSDRILSRYGDTPLGMVEAALEFLRICEEENYYDVVLSMKASNTQVMVQAYRLLVQKLDEEGLQPYPLHLGVTEAGEAEDGRIKSAVGIGTLLEDGLGDTVRVSLTEAPEHEMPVGRALVGRIEHRPDPGPVLPDLAASPLDPFTYSRRESLGVFNLGHRNVPRVIADFSELDARKQPVLLPRLRRLAIMDNREVHSASREAVEALHAARGSVLERLVMQYWPWKCDWEGVVFRGFETEVGDLKVSFVHEPEIELEM